jgi:hypothetical protein
MREPIVVFDTNCVLCSGMVHDLVIRGATVVDGFGHDPIRTDLAVRDGRISRLYRRRRRSTHRRGSPPS